MQPQNPFSPSDDQQRTHEVVHVARPLDPSEPHLSDEILQKHEESKQRFPHLNLSKGEYVISEVHRHPVGLMQIWFFSGLIVAVLTAALAWVISYGRENAAASGPVQILVLIILLVMLGVIIGAGIGTNVFTANRFYLTNESVIQYIQNSLFNKRVQAVSLGNIEDASYTQQGIPSHMFNYGMIRLSTEGDETTYRFAYASQPEKQVAILNNAVEAFKNGRPIEW